MVFTDPLALAAAPADLRWRPSMRARGVVALPVSY
jgi:hypothetical protein